MQYPHVFVCFALVPLATSAVAECLKSNVEGQFAQGQLAIGRARDAGGRPETPTSANQRPSDTSAHSNFTPTAEVRPRRRYRRLM
jgi:hypothetical protein